MLKAHTPGARKGADFLVHVDPAQLKAQGVELVGMYLKNTTRERIDAYHKAGISVFLIHQRGYEGRGPDPAGAGRRHGEEANVQAAALGYPLDMPIVFASMGDYDNTAATIPGSVAYAKAAKRACRWPVGWYADWDLQEVLAKEAPGVFNVQTAARAWSFDWIRRRYRGIHPAVHIEQRPPRAVAKQNVSDDPNRLDWYGVAVDPLNIIKPINGWSNRITPPPPAKPPVQVTVARPTLRWRLPNMSGAEVILLQRQMKFWRWYTGPVNGRFGTVTRDAVKKMQRALRVPVDGIYGPVTAAAFKRFAEAMAAIAAGNQK